MMSWMAHAGRLGSRRFVALAMTLGLAACVESVDLRSAQDSGVPGSSDAMQVGNGPMDASPDANAAHDDALTGGDHPDSGSVPSGDAEPTDSGRVDHPDAGSGNDAASDHDTGTTDTGHEAGDAGINTCEQNAFDCLDSIENGGHCPAPRSSESFACTRLNTRERICCSRLLDAG